MGSYQAPRPLGREESRGGGHTVPRGATGKGRGAAKLDARSSRRSAVAAEMLLAPPPLPPPRQPPRGKLTRAVGREESEAVPGTPGGTRRGRNSEGGGRADRQTDSEGTRAGANGALRGGATAARPPRRRVLSWGRPRPALGAAPGPYWDGAGRERCVPETRHPQLRAGIQEPAGARRGCAWEDFPARRQGLHVALTARSRPLGSRPMGADAETLGRWRGYCPTRKPRSWPLRAQAEFSQFPRVLLCLPAAA